MAFLAPEVAGAAEAAGEAKAAKAAKSAGGAGAAKRRPGSAAEHRAAIDKIRAARQEKGLPLGETQEEADAKGPAAKSPVSSPAGGAPDGKSSGFTAMDPVHTGSGFVLGTLAWVVFMNYLRGGMPQVRRWGAAKFLNKVTPTGGTK